MTGPRLDYGATLERIEKLSPGQTTTARNPWNFIKTVRARHPGRRFTTEAREGVHIVTRIE